MDKEKLAYFKKLLLEHQKELLEELNKSSEDIGQLQQGPFPADWGDKVSMNDAMNFLMTLENDRSLQMREIARALRKIEEGSYGICEKCGQQLSFDRLEAVPYARFCLKCQDQEEKARTAPRETRGYTTFPNELLEWYE